MTPAALREIQKIRRILGLPPWPWPIKRGEK